MKGSFVVGALLALKVVFPNSISAADQELLNCSRAVGQAKTECSTNVLLDSSDVNMTYTLLYDYTCKYNLSSHEPVITPGPLAENHQTNYSFRKGGGTLEIPEAKEIYFRYFTEGQPYFHKDCSLVLKSLTKRPADSTIELLSQEARRLTGLLEAKGETFRNIADFDNLISNYSLPKLRIMSSDLEKIFASTVELALTEKDDGGPSGPPGPPGPFGPPGSTGSSSGIKPPSEFGLDYDSWQELDVFELGLVTLSDDEPRFDITLDPTLQQHQWYFEAKSTLPVISSLLSQLAIVKGSTLLKEQAEHSGFVLPSKDEIKGELVALIDEAKGFLLRVEEYKDALKEQLKALNESITKNEV